MMTHDRLRHYADRFIDFINNSPPDLDKLSSLVAPDIDTPLTYPGMPSGYIGVKKTLEKIHASLIPWSLTVLTSVIDEESSRVVYFVKSSGVQAG